MTEKFPSFNNKESENIKNENNVSGKGKTQENFRYVKEINSKVSEDKIIQSGSKTHRTLYKLRKDKFKTSSTDFRSTFMSQVKFYK